MKTDTIKQLYLNKDIEYFSLERELFKSNIKRDNLNILDVGCGSGALGAFLIANQNCKVHGFEINSNIIDIAKNNLTSVVEGNIETDPIPFEFKSFDYIVLGDVLEHLINPIPTLEKLKKYLSKDGILLVTTPNVKHWSVTYNLIFKDDWQYKDWGILDYTHLRFFTKKSLTNMLMSNNITDFQIEWIIQKPSKSHIINKAFFNLFEGFLASHVFLKIKA
jgi:2-polyprenyl-3-methyl-5-hydroxy-6-metoxy-1,4-benzoquinol methylase